jgi:preprotein translocase subunit Sec61beta
MRSITVQSKVLKTHCEESVQFKEIIPMPKTTKKRRKKKGDGPMPSGGAGLIRFFEDETPGIKVGPTMVVILSAIMIVATVIAHLSSITPTT